MSDPSRHYFKELRLQQFRGLLALAHWQTFAAAASSLGLTRASVWQQVRSLERELGCALLRTRGQRVEFTDAGNKLVEIVSPLVAGFDSIKAALHASIEEDPQQTLVIASPPSFIVHELREPITRIYAELPSLLLTFLERNSPAAIEILEQGGADIAIAGHPDNMPVSPSLIFTRLTTYPFTLICPPAHPLLAEKKPTLRDLVRNPLILPASVTYCRQHFDVVVGRAGLMGQVNIVLESNSPIMLFDYVRLGLGVALCPLPAAPLPPEKQSGVVPLDVSHLFGSEPIYHVRRKGEFETPAATRFRELLTDCRDAVHPLPDY